MNTYHFIGLVGFIIAVTTLIVQQLEHNRKNTWDIQELPVSRTWVWICRILVGALFLFSGFVKANDYMGFGYKLEEYFYVFSMSWMVPTAMFGAWFISVFEIAVGVAVLVGFRMRITAWLLLLMMVFFTFLTGYSAITGAVTDCGCFGDALKITPTESFLKDIILTLLIIPIFRVRKSIQPTPNVSVATFLTAFAFMVSGVYSYYCHENLPVVDYRAYKVGVDLNICTTQPGPDGIPKCKDWEPFPYESDEMPDLFAGKTLMIVMYDMDLAPPEQIKKTVELSNALQGSGTKVVMATSTGPSSLKGYVSEYQLPYPIIFMDQTVLKTIVRSTPGYMLLENGVIKGKWHYNNTPDVSQPPF